MAAAQDRQRSADLARVELARREAREVALALAPDHRPEELFLAGKMGINGRLRYAGFARDRIHADRPETGGEKAPLGRGEDAFRLAVRRRIVAVDVFHRACCGLPLGDERRLDSI